MALFFPAIKKHGTSYCSIPFPSALASFTSLQNNYCATTVLPLKLSTTSFILAPLLTLFGLNFSPSSSSPLQCLLPRHSFLGPLAVLDSLAGSTGIVCRPAMRWLSMLYGRPTVRLPMTIPLPHAKPSGSVFAPSFISTSAPSRPLVMLLALALSRRSLIS